jgi:hypothetical protein
MLQIKQKQNQETCLLISNSNIQWAIAKIFFQHTDVRFQPHWMSTAAAKRQSGIGHPLTMTRVQQATILCYWISSLE